MKKNITLYILLSILLFSLTNCSTNEPKNACDCVKLLDASTDGGKPMDEKYNQICNKLIQEKTGIANLGKLKGLDYEKFFKLVYECTGNKVPVPITGTYSNGRQTFIINSDGTAVYYNSKEMLDKNLGWPKSWSGTPDSIAIISIGVAATPDHAVITFSGLNWKYGPYLERQ